MINSHLLYQLSYRGIAKSGRAAGRRPEGGCIATRGRDAKPSCHLLHAGIGRRYPIDFAIFLTEVLEARTGIEPVWKDLQSFA